MNYNLYFQNSVRSDLIGYNMSTVCIEKKGSISNSLWKAPVMGMQGTLCIGHETGEKDILMLEIRENHVPLEFEPRRNRWTPKWCETYYRSIPLESYYKKSGCFVVKEKKCITDEDVFVSEFCITNNKKETVTLQMKMVTPLEKMEENTYKIQTPIIPKALGEKFVLKGWFAFYGMEMEQVIEIPAGESVTYKYCFAFSCQSEKDAKEKARMEFENTKSFSDNEDRLNQWFYKMVPDIITDNKDIEKMYYYRYLLIYINTFMPEKVIPEHYISGECMYENRYGAWYGCPVALPLSLQVDEAKWLKESGLAKNQLNMWMGNRTVFRWYIQYTPYCAYMFYQHHENKQWLEKIYDILKEYTLQKYNEDTLLPVMEGSWGTGAEYQPAFYQWTEPKWDWRFDKEGKALGFPIQKLYRLDEISFFAANLKACAEIAKELGKESDYLYFNNLKECVVDTIKSKFWNEKDKLFYDIDAATNKQCNEAACYDSFAPFLFHLIEEENYTECFDKLFDDTWFADEFSTTTVAKNCPMYWFDNCIIGPTAAGLKNPHEYECCWNGPIWPFATSLILNALGAVAEKNSKYRKQWIALFDKYTELHFLNGDRSIPAIFEHYRPGDGMTFSRACDYFHSSWIDLFMHYWVGISVNNGEVLFQPFSEEEFEIKSVLIKGNYYTFKQFYEEGELKRLSERI
ncbi:MAG: hypothetical protein IJZ44_03705 [Lachnospiraceae bacterium]|nr:hypothetical protein [Lachnospiraceae bacterium]MBQ8232306.1 hypothetical protein [Lachnospiraceae bacterium]